MASKAKTKKKSYLVDLKQVKEQVTIKARACYVDARGTLTFCNSIGGYSPAIVAAFAAGSWLKVAIIDGDDDDDQP
jgi:hypothetical protein